VGIILPGACLDAGFLIFLWDWLSLLSAGIASFSLHTLYESSGRAFAEEDFSLRAAGREATMPWGK